MSCCTSRFSRTSVASERIDPARFNVAHDYIINDVLVEALGRPIPAGGLEWSGARHMSAEQIMRQRYWSRGYVPSAWNAPTGRTTALGDALSKAGLTAPEKEASDLAGGDALSDELERRWFPGVSRAEQAHSRRQVKSAATKASGLAALRVAMGRLEDSRSGGEEQAIAALHSLYRPPSNSGGRARQARKG